MKKILGYDFDDLFDVVGLERRRSAIGVTLSAIGLVALGAGIGAAAGLMFAPSSGRRFRRDVTDRLGQVRERMKGDLNTNATATPS